VERGSGCCPRDSGHERRQLTDVDLPLLAGILVNLVSAQSVSKGLLSLFGRTSLVIER
jgi:hypothetical protein